MAMYITLPIAAIAAILGLAATQTLNVPLAALALGFAAVGYAMPGLLEGTTQYSKTLWLPLGFAAAAAFGTWLVFQGAAFQVIFGAQWCALPPCIPIGWTAACFIIGNAARLLDLALSGEKLDLFGEHVKG